MKIRKIQKPKVALLTTTWFPLPSAASNYVKELAVQLVSAGFEVDILARNIEGKLDKNVKEFESLKGVNVKRFGFKSRAKNPLMKVWFVFAATLYLAVKGRHYKLVHAHSLSSSIAMKLGARPRTPRLLTIHEYHLKQRGFWLKRLFERILYTETVYTQLISVSESFLKRNNINESILVIPSGIDLEPYENFKAEKHPEQFRILYVGRVLSSSGLDTLLRSCKDMIESNDYIQRKKDFRLHIVGDGPYRKKLEKLAKKLEISGFIKWTPRLTRKKMIQAYKEADLFVLPNVREGFPYTLLWACASRLPVIASDLGDHKKLVLENVNGHLMQAGNREDLSYYMTQFALNPQLAQMGDASFEIVQNEYDWKTVGEKHRRLYESLIDGSTSVGTNFNDQVKPWAVPGLWLKQMRFKKKYGECSNQAPLSICLTVNLETSPQSDVLPEEEELADFLERFSEFTATLHAPATLFVSHDFVEPFYEELRAMNDGGHEIGYRPLSSEWKDIPSQKKTIRLMEQLKEQFPFEDVKQVRPAIDFDEEALDLLVQADFDALPTSEDPLKRVHWHGGLPYGHSIRMNLEDWLRLSNEELLESVESIRAYQAAHGLQPYIIFESSQWEFMSQKSAEYASGENFSLLSRKLAYLRDHLSIEFLTLNDFLDSLHKKEKAD